MASVAAHQLLSRDVAAAADLAEQVVDGLDGSQRQDRVVIDDPGERLGSVEEEPAGPPAVEGRGRRHALLPEAAHAPPARPAPAGTMAPGDTGQGRHPRVAA